jgi:DNA uptake protein ComE-like DNA-binding protein
LLLLLTFGAGVAPFLLYTSSPPQELRRDQADLDSLVALLALQADRPAPAGKAPKRRQPLKSFDPNKLSREEWRQLGLSAFATANILKYRERAGGFRYKEQLARIYGLSPEQYRELAPYIDLPARASAPTAFRPRTPRRYDPGRPRTRPRVRLAAFDINTADTTELKKIRGIGSRLSGRIIRFRDKLGGFAHLGQLQEVYGLPAEVVDSLHKYVFIQPGFSPRQINLNTASLPEMQAHPYLGYRTGRLILAYRTQHGPFQSLDDLARIHQISAGQLEKMRPYLRL